MRDRLIVLKFGGSVLRNEQALPEAVHEIYRWRRDGWRVVAVVSALEGVTDQLHARATRISSRLEPHALAATMSQGEHESAAFLNLHLARAGVPSCVLTPHAVGFLATGDPLDSDPSDLNDLTIKSALNAHGVVVFPGFIACDQSGRTVTLGRGGSDLTALFLAHRLSADRCRLIKDVPGLYDRDPAVELATAPRLFQRAHWLDALERSGAVLQPKAVQFAMAHERAFEISQCNRDIATLIGPYESRYCNLPARARPLRVALLGLGIVGGGVYELLRRFDEEIKITAIAVRDLHRKRDIAPPREFLTTDPVAACAGADIVIEAMGGVEPALRAARAALSGGAHFVTANKALIAEHGGALSALAKTNARSLLCSAAVGGSVPLLETISAHPSPPVAITGVLNGAVNFILTKHRQGAALKAAVAEAQSLGLTEADPSRDLSGQDALDKLRVLARHLGHDQIRIEACDDLRDACASTIDPSHTVRQLSHLDLSTNPPVATVRIRSLPPDHPFAGIDGAANAAQIHDSHGDHHLIRGVGAGRWPTAEAVLGDVLQIVRQRETIPREIRRPERTRRSTASPEHVAAHCTSGV